MSFKPLATLTIFSLFLGLLISCAESLNENSNTVYDPDPTLIIGGERPARVVLPDDYDVKRRYPLVFLLHGYGVNSGVQNFIYHLVERTTSHQFILVLPEGTHDSYGKRFWNATPVCCWFKHDNPVDDVAYLDGLIEEAKRVYAVDPHRISFTGHSNGGYMSYRMACEVPEKVRRIAVLAGSVFINEANCKGTKAVSVLHMHGTEDDTVPYHNNLNEGGAGVGVERPLRTVGAEAAIDRWRVKAGCSENYDVSKAHFLGTIGEEGAGEGGGETDVLTWTGCQEGIDIVLWRLNGGEHLLPNVNERFRDGVVEFLLRKDR